MFVKIETRTEVLSEKTKLNDKENFGSVIEAKKLMLLELTIFWKMFPDHFFNIKVRSPVTFRIRLFFGLKKLDKISKYLRSSIVIPIFRGKDLIPNQKKKTFKTLTVKNILNLMTFDLKS
jgi:hypothetical protein